LAILKLHRIGIRQRKIAPKLGISRETVKKYIENPVLPDEKNKSRKRPSQLDPFMDNINGWLEEGPGKKIITPFCLAFGPSAALYPPAHILIGNMVFGSQKEVIAAGDRSCGRCGG
jgi:hypothetical protein